METITDHGTEKPGVPDPDIYGGRGGTSPTEIFEVEQACQDGYDAGYENGKAASGRRKVEPVTVEPDDFADVNDKDEVRFHRLEWMTDAQ